MLDGIGVILEERTRQKLVEGWTETHDDQYSSQELIKASQSYLMAAEFAEQFPGKDPAKMLAPMWWPWDRSWWKPSIDPIRNLEKAGALIAAEIDRLQRAAMRSEPNSKGGE